MAEIIDFNTKRDENIEFFTGIAMCVHCHHKWTAQVEAPTKTGERIPELQCEKCGLQKGYLMLIEEPLEDRWECECLGDLFFITRDGNKVCARCNKITPN